jgi:hypothetical protein
MHKYKFECKNVKGHSHRLSGYAGNMLGVDSIHFHFYYGVSSYDNHTHYFCGITGMPIKTENGHIHKMDGMLETYSLHEHEFRGCTFEDVSYFTSRQAVTFER